MSTTFILRLTGPEPETDYPAFTSENGASVDNYACAAATDLARIAQTDPLPLAAGILLLPLVISHIGVVLELATRNGESAYLVHADAMLRTVHAFTERMAEQVMTASLLGLDE